MKSKVLFAWCALFPFLALLIPKAPQAQTQAAYEVAETKNVMVAMRDGVRLATDIYRPARNGNRRTADSQLCWSVRRTTRNLRVPERFRRIPCAGPVSRRTIRRIISCRAATSSSFRTCEDDSSRRDAGVRCAMIPTTDSTRPNGSPNSHGPTGTSGLSGSHMKVERSSLSASPMHRTSRR